MNNASQTDLSTIRGLLFDWDGTIVDSRLSMFLSMQYAYQKHVGILFPRDEEEFRRIAPMRMVEHAAIYAKEHAAAVAESYIWYYANEGHKKGNIFPGMRETLAELRKRGYALGVVTNTTRQRMQADLDHLQLANAIDSIVTADETTERKPHPAPLLKGAEKLQLAPRELAYIGDFSGDILAAHAAGMLSVAALYGGVYLIESVLAAQPTCTIQTPPDLLNLFPGIADAQTL